MTLRFEQFLDALSDRVDAEMKATTVSSATQFENLVRQQINAFGGFDGHLAHDDVHPHAFPDISLGSHGLELKFTKNDSWRSVANSILESSRDQDVEHVYVLYGKAGGEAGVRWARYEHVVIHVRTSHVPRFEIDIDAEENLFDQFGISYDEFRMLDLHQKMVFIRDYAREHRKPGERHWWIQDPDEDDHSLELQARLYTSLDSETKKQLRAEMVLLCPQIVRGSRARHKYDDAVLYAMTYRGVLCHQARDLFSAGSVAGVERGGNYLQRSLQHLQPYMVRAAQELDDELFLEYWGQSCPPEERIKRWLQKADEECTDWKPSDCMFLEI